MPVGWCVFGSNYKVTFFPPSQLGVHAQAIRWHAPVVNVFQKNTGVTTSETARMELTRKTAVSPFQSLHCIWFHICPFGILSNLLDLLMDRNAYNMPLVIEISRQILLWIRGDVLIEIYFYENLLSVSCLST